MMQQAEDKTKIQIDQYLERWSPQSDFYQELAARLRRLDDEAAAPIRRLGITSCVRGEGVSTVAFQLAATLSRSFGISVTLVDANPDHPTFENFFDQTSASKNVAGLFNALDDGWDVAECVFPTTIENLTLMSLGHPAWGKPNYLADRIANLFTSLSEHADLVLLDLPVVGPTAHWQALSPQLDGVLLVVASGKTQAPTAHLAKHQLDEANVKLLGIVLNKWVS